jgi:hypothetical protein
MSGITPKNMKNILQSFGEYLNIVYKLKLDDKLEDKETTWDEVVASFMKEKKQLFKEKKTRVKKEKLEGEPKKPTSAFFLFSKDKREEMAEETGKKGTELTKELGMRWKEMDDEDKEFYIEKYLAAKEEYDQEIKNFKEENPNLYQDKEKPKKSRKLTGYNLFCKEKRREIKEENDDMSPPEIMKELGRLWSQLDEDEKKEWNLKASEDDNGSDSDEVKKVPKRKVNKSDDEKKSKKSDDEEGKPKKIRKSKKSDEEEEKPKKIRKSKKSDDEEEKPKKIRKSKKSDDEDSCSENSEDSSYKLENMKVPQLKLKAEQLRIDDYKNMKKNQLIEAIKSRLEEELEDDE